MRRRAQLLRATVTHPEATRRAPGRGAPSHPPRPRQRRCPRRPQPEDPVRPTRPRDAARSPSPSASERHCTRRRIRNPRLSAPLLLLASHLRLASAEAEIRHASALAPHAAAAPSFTPPSILCYHANDGVDGACAFRISGALGRRTGLRCCRARPAASRCASRNSDNHDRRQSDSRRGNDG
jgi:hypothetical protein